MDFLLWSKAEQIARAAEHQGATQPLTVTSQVVQEEQLSFVIHQLSGLKPKSAGNRSKTEPSSYADTDPFLQHDPALFISHVGSEHKLLLNKFNLLKQHLLLVTQQFEAQEQVLSQTDWRALFGCLTQGDALAFYNSCAIAGASQPHKHMQLVHLPPNPEALFPLYSQFQQLHDEVPRQLSNLPYTHSALALPPNLFTQQSPDDAAVQLKHLYDRLRISLNLECQADQTTPAYNLLMTQKWMMIVPRVQEHFLDISFNALAFMGSIFVKTPQQAQALTQAGLAQVLTRLSGANTNNN